jgi:phospholipid/cholesterol/gamma-HCH transport system ATP-binding protein
LQPDRGTVRIDGESLADPEVVARARRELGVLFQSGGLFDSLTALENVMFPLRELLHLGAPEAAQRARAALALVRLEGAEALRPAEMSGGMQKRLAFARAIVAHPRILVLDDPTAGLDPLMTDAVVETIRRGQRELHASTLLVTSDLRCAFRTADRLALLQQGRILLDAPPDEFERSTIPAVEDFLRRWKERKARAPEAPPFEAGPEPHAPDPYR